MASRAAKIGDCAHSEVLLDTARRGDSVSTKTGHAETHAAHTALMCGRDVRRGTLRGASFVAVVETADFGHHDDGSDGCLSCRSSIRSIFFKPDVRPAAVIVAKVRREDAPKMRLVHDDDVIETLPSD
jgi:hypothetical protein